MDIALFVNLQKWTVPINGDNRTVKETFSAFYPLSVKLIMVDHVTHYVHDILARFVEYNLHFSSLIPGVTVHQISYAGLLAALIGSRLMISDEPKHYRIGAILFELRNLADSLDGVIYRSRKRQHDIGKIVLYESDYGSYGNNVDFFCDFLGGLFFCTAILIKFLKYQPSKYPKIFLIRRPKAYILDTFHTTKTQMNSQRRSVSSFQVKLLVFFFSFRLLFTGLIWDHFVQKYHDLLMVFFNNPNVHKMQEQTFKSISMWLIMWLWRFGNPCAILEHLSITTFCGKLWDYLVFTNYIGWVYLIVLTKYFDANTLYRVV
ncbi:ceramide phosphoethanolamine synthase-like isoform X3 [Brachionus plicatilis]|uniref:Ceramide phosphoethanolamine synthase-like isoform X3 n=1 Tax=Brachionus plicatilis TaxID=10195 RepID=A0A3M7RXZ8_BRAPC|nr:ceramide phosphoethanolamine synthase-like isoform X3 [Brachionus plicatilis]